MIDRRGAMILLGAALISPRALAYTGEVHEWNEGGTDVYSKDPFDLDRVLRPFRLNYFGLTTYQNDYFIAAFTSGVGVQEELLYDGQEFDAMMFGADKRLPKVVAYPSRWTPVRDKTMRSVAWYGPGGIQIRAAIPGVCGNTSVRKGTLKMKCIRPDGTPLVHLS